MNKVLKNCISGIFACSLMMLNSYGLNCESHGIIFPGGIYTSENTDEHIAIQNDTLRLYKSVEGSAEMLAECSMKLVKDNWYKISSFGGFQQAPFADMSIKMSDSRIYDPEIKITIITPNCMRPLPVAVGAQSKDGFSSKQVYTIAKNGVATVSIPLCSKFTLLLGYTDITPSVPSGRFLGLIGYSEEIELENNRIKTIEMVLPNVTEEILDRYYIDNEFIYATDSCIYRKGVKFVKKQ